MNIDHVIQVFKVTRDWQNNETHEFVDDCDAIIRDDAMLYTKKYNDLNSQKERVEAEITVFDFNQFDENGNKVKIDDFMISFDNEKYRVLGLKNNTMYENSVVLRVGYWQQ